MKKILRLALLASLLSPLFTQNFILDNPDSLIVPKSQDFIQELSSQLKEKTGFGLYVVAIDKIDGEGKEARDAFKKRFDTQLSTPYGVIFFFKSNQKIDIILSPNLGIDRDKIITQYMVPILMQDKEMSPSKISAAILNGYAQLADEIASKYGVVLEGNLIVDKSGVQDFVHYAVYVMLGVMFGLIGLIYWTRNRK